MIELPQWKVTYNKLPMELKSKLVDEFEEDVTFRKVSLLYLRIIRVIGLLPFEGQDFNCTGTRICLTLFHISSFIHLSMWLLYCFNVPHLVGAGTICEVVVIVSLNIRYYIMVPKRVKLLELTIKCEELWNELCSGMKSAQRTVYKIEQKLRLILVTYIASGISVLSLFNFVSITTTVPCGGPNGTRCHPLPYKWFTEHENDIPWPGYAWSYIIGNVIVYNACVIAIASDILAPFLMTICAGYFRCLHDRLMDTIDHRDNYIVEKISLYDNELNYCCKIHQKLLNFSHEIGKLTQTFFMVQIMGTAYNLSLLGVKIMSSDPEKPKYISLMFACLVQLYLCQWPPDFILHESATISTAIYSVSETWLKRRLGTNIIIMLARAQRPVYMTAGGIVTLCLETFGSMMSSAVSFFTLLRKFNL